MGGNSQMSLHARWAKLTPAVFLLALSFSFKTASAQEAAPFYSADATAYEAQISTAENGTLLSASVNVSNNRKYVTMGSQATVAGTPNFTPFALSMPAGGTFVGSSTGGGIGIGNTPAPAILDRPGMTLIAPLQP